MTRFTSVIGAFLIAVCAPLAHADFVIDYSVNGGAAVQCADVVSASPNNNATCPIISADSGLLSVFGVAGLGSQGTPTQQLDGTISYSYTGSTPLTLTVWYFDTDFSAPVAPPDIDYSSQLGYSTTTRTPLSTIGLESCVETGNSTATSPFCAAGPSLTNATLTLGSNGSDGATTVLTSLAAPYALSQQVTLSLTGASSGNFSVSQNLTPVPEPASLILLGSGLLGLGVVVRRKMQSKRA
jgi:hypothetical protein